MKDKYAVEMTHEERLRADEDYREKYINGCVDDLIAPDAQFYPFTFPHIWEAIGELGHAGQFLLATHISYVAALPGNSLAQRDFSNVVVIEIKQYWRGVARAVVIERMKL